MLETIQLSSVEDTGDDNEGRNGFGGNSNT